MEASIRLYIRMEIDKKLKRKEQGKKRNVIHIHSERIGFIQNIPWYPDLE